MHWSCPRLKGSGQQSMARGPAARGNTPPSPPCPPSACPVIEAPAFCEAWQPSPPRPPPAVRFVTRTLVEKWRLLLGQAHACGEGRGRSAGMLHVSVGHGGGWGKARGIGLGPLQWQASHSRGLPRERLHGARWRNGNGSMGCGRGTPPPLPPQQRPGLAPGVGSLAQAVLVGGRFVLSCTANTQSVWSLLRLDGVGTVGECRTQVSAGLGSPSVGGRPARTDRAAPVAGRAAPSSAQGPGQGLPFS